MKLARHVGADTLRVEADVVTNPNLPQSLVKASSRKLPTLQALFSKKNR